MYSKVFLLFFLGDKKKTVGGGRREEAEGGGSGEFIQMGIKLEACVVFSSVTDTDIQCSPPELRGAPHLLLSNKCNTAKGPLTHRGPFYPIE